MLYVEPRLSPNIDDKIKHAFERVQHYELTNVTIELIEHQSGVCLDAFFKGVTPKGNNISIPIGVISLVGSGGTVPQFEDKVNGIIRQY